MKVNLFLLSFILFIISSCENKLETKVQTIKARYVSYACDCASWVLEDDIDKYSEVQSDTLSKLAIFIEPANSALELPDTIGVNRDLLEFTGSFYEKKGFPKEYQSPERVEKARVFRYTSYRVIESYHHEFQLEFAE